MGRLSEYDDVEREVIEDTSRLDKQLERHHDSDLNSPDPVWNVGDMVCFHHDKSTPMMVTKVAVGLPGQLGMSQFVELDRFVGLFSSRLFAKYSKVGDK